MDKKIITIFSLLIIVVSIVLIYSYQNNSIIDEEQFDSSNENITEENVAEEIDNLFVEEDDEIEIGEMV